MTHRTQNISTSHENQSFAFCPTCQRLAAQEVRQVLDGVASANFLCPQGHIWLTKWMAAA